MGEYEKLGKVIGDAAIFMYVYGAIIAVVIILLGVLAEIAAIFICLGNRCKV